MSPNQTQGAAGQLPPPVPLRPFADPAEVRRTAARRLYPAQRRTIAETALAHRMLRNPGGGYTGPWRHDEVPYLVEPMEMQTERRICAVVFIGPAQSAKTEGLIVNPILHAVTVDPADMLLIQTTDYMARDFSRRRLRRMLEDHPAMRGKLLEVKGSDNLLDKSFQGMILSLGTPTINQLSGRPLPRIYLTDYDRMPLDVDGEGSAFALGRKRSQTFGSRGMTVAESSLGHALAIAKWKAKTPHEAPPAPGIASLYNMGDRRRWYWVCKGCGEYFEGRFKHFSYGESGDPATRAAKVEMICPVNGCRLPPAVKFDMNKTGIWVPEGMSVAPGGLLTGDARNSDIASYWLFGPAAAYQAWPQMVQRFIEAQAEYDSSGDDAPLKATLNTDQSEVYFLPRIDAEETIEAEALADRAIPGIWQRVPPGARYITAGVDVQGNRFEVIFRAWGEEFESWIIDRFVIFKAADGERPVDPAKRPEDWDMLEAQVLVKSYPVDDMPGARMAARRVGIDSAGRAGVTAEAYDFLRRVARKDRTRDGPRLAPRIVLTKGTGRLDAPRVVKTYPDSQRKDRKAAGRGEIPVLLMNVNKLKDELFNQLSREPGQPRCIYIAAELRDEAPPHEFFEQLTAEERRADGTWHKVRKRNEPIDLMVIAQAAAMQAKGDRLNWAKPPAWARRDEDNPQISIDPAAVEAAAGPAPVEATKRAPEVKRRRRRPSGYVSR